MISKKTKYGLQALLTLAARHGQGPMLIADLAEREKMPRKFLEMILLQLNNAGILASRKGKGGGYFLARDPAEVTMGEAIQVLEGPLGPVPCVSSTGAQECEECTDIQSCGIRLVMKDVHDAMAEILDGTTLVEVLNRSHEARQKAKKVIDFTI